MALYKQLIMISDIAEELINIPSAKRSEPSLVDTTSQNSVASAFSIVLEKEGNCGAYADFKQNTGSKKYDILGVVSGTIPSARLTQLMNKMSIYLQIMIFLLIQIIFMAQSIQLQKLEST